MDEETAILVENVSKKFARTLSQSMAYGISDIARNTVGISSQSEKLRTGEFWAVDNVSFELKKGEVLGIIGSNGSGKSTILKMLNGIFWPDKGAITIKGRVGALIEVGAGFHPMLTGRENIYVNAAILGMTKKEVDEKYDDIIKFADIGDFLDSPVKNYSSGMYVRLGFAVAAHCEPDVLLVDEVLAVGDLAFALKCHRKMSEFRQSGGTVILVTHSTQAIRNMCNKVMWIESGIINGVGDVHQICDLYEKKVMMRDINDHDDMQSKLSYDSKIDINKVEFLDERGQPREEFDVGSKLKIRIHFKCGRTVVQPIFVMSIYNAEDLVMCSNYSNLDGFTIDCIKGAGYVDFSLGSIPFKPSRYLCSITLSEKEVSNAIVWHEKCHAFTVSGGLTNYGLFNPFPTWSLSLTRKVNEGKALQ
jgi:lipopolysaccharide transport system ATP-binding protein